VSILRSLHPLSWAARLLAWTAPTRKVCGVPVTVTSRDERIFNSLFEKVAGGLEVLRRYHPRGYATVRRHIRRVLVGFLPNAQAAWWGPPRACMLSIEYFAEESATPSDVALSLLHEAMHGRLEARGFRYTRHLRFRLEATCTRAEMELAERLPGQASRLTTLNSRLEELGYLYGAANLQAGRLYALRKLQAPSWLVRAVQWFNRSAA
jgi:hypothetical protein